jgi:hypothetical protein
MLKHQWRPFGIPSLITSDQGAHFANEWWKTMCAKLGIRQGFSQAYHHQANGRAEMAGQQIMEKLRKLQEGGKINWVEALPAVLDRIHDITGETGLSPYQILFGRDRPMAGIPYTPPKECESAQQFFSKMAHIDRAVAKLLNDIHERQLEKLNAKRWGGYITPMTKFITAAPRAAAPSWVHDSGDLPSWYPGRGSTVTSYASKKML